MRSTRDMRIGESRNRSTRRYSPATAGASGDGCRYCRIPDCIDHRRHDRTSRQSQGRTRLCEAFTGMVDGRHATGPFRDLRIVSSVGSWIDCGRAQSSNSARRTIMTIAAFLREAGLSWSCRAWNRHQRPRPGILALSPDSRRGIEGAGSRGRLVRCFAGDRSIHAAPRRVKIVMTLNRTLWAFGLPAYLEFPPRKVLRREPVASILLSGPAGAAKSALARRLLVEHPNLAAIADFQLVYRALTDVIKGSGRAVSVARRAVATAYRIHPAGHHHGCGKRGYRRDRHQ